jgi:hypothetical protein
MVKRNQAKFNLSFIDIISCGLGAVILLLVLIKDSPFFIQKETVTTSVDIETFENLVNEISNINSENLDLEALLDLRKSTLSSSEKDISDLNQILIDAQEKINIKPSPKPEEKKNYISSCSLEKDNTLILLDTSASMIAYKFTDVIKNKSLPSELKVDSKKFNIAKNLIGWLIESASSNITIDLGFFSDKAEIITNVPLTGQNILQDPDILSKLSTKVPNGSTNLSKSFKSIDLRDYESLFIITDGLPTGGFNTYLDENEKRSASQFLSLCDRKKLATSDCREKYHEEAFEYLNEKNRSIEVNVLLLYLEGDPRAPLLYGLQTIRSNGCFITIPKDWS